MSRTELSLCLILMFVSVSQLRSEEPRDDAAQAAGVLKKRMVSIEVSFVELAEKPRPEEALDAEASQKLIARIRELETQDKLTGLTRVRLSTLEDNVATSLSGSQAPVVTGRNAFSSQRGGGGGPAGATITQLRDFGTVVTATPRVEPGDTILIDLQIEKSNPAGDARVPNTDPTRADGTLTARSTTTTVRSTVRVANGQTIVIQSSGSSSPTEGSSRSVILLKAHADAAPNVAADKLQALKFTIFHLRHAQAAETADVLRELIANKQVRIVSDPRSNSLMVSAAEADLQVVEAVVKALDQMPGKEAATPKKPPE